MKSIFAIAVMFAVMSFVPTVLHAKDKPKPTSMESGRVVSVGSEQECKGCNDKIQSYDIPLYTIATSDVIYSVVRDARWVWSDTSSSLHVGETVQLYKHANSIRVNVNGKMQKFNILGEIAK